MGQLMCGSMEVQGSPKPGGVERARRVVSMALQLLLILQEEPRLMEEQKLLVPPVVVGKGEHKKTLRPSLFEPRWIGKHYRIPREQKNGDGHHASPILHWRCGHWRSQRWGLGRRDVKTIWIEPTMVNADSGKEPEA